MHLVSWDSFVEGALNLPQTAPLKEWSEKVEDLVEKMEQEGGLAKLIETSRGTVPVEEGHSMTEVSVPQAEASSLFSETSPSSSSSLPPREKSDQARSKSTLMLCLVRRGRFKAEQEGKASSKC